MSGLYVNLALGFLIALAFFGGLLAVVFWLYRLSFGQPLHLPMARFNSRDNLALVAVFALFLAGGLAYMYQIASKDFAMRNTYTLTYTQPIDYMIASLILMPPLFWFGGSLLSSRGGGSAGGGMVGDSGPVDEDRSASDQEEPEPQAELAESTDEGDSST